MIIGTAMSIPQVTGCMTDQHFIASAPFSLSSTPRAGHACSPDLSNHNIPKAPGHRRDELVLGFCAVLGAFCTAGSAACMATMILSADTITTIIRATCGMDETPAMSYIAD